ncbi:glycosyltransferase family 4 protein [Pseudanabaena sp. FACHB-1277]|uniref:Glycosyltransferase family 4 protein n=2 Tax=Pseudanabaena TaxID=1152 RepID=A0A926Z7S5_9CYAN|nr:glycosyltransferase family 4 protein [Pseudanabaena cinerea FACHB-1277]
MNIDAFSNTVVLETKNLKVGIFFTNFGPYHIARVKAARDICQPLGINIFGLEIARSSVEYPWQSKTDHLNFDLITISSDHRYEHIPRKKLISDLIKKLNEINPDILLLSGYSEISMLVALFWSKSRGKKAVLMSESKQDDAPRSRYKELFKKFIVSFYDAAIVGGQPHQRYLENLDMPKDSIFFGYDVVNNNDFDRDKIRHLPRPIKFPFFLAINRFIPKKNLIFLLSAYAQYLQRVDQTSAWHLVLCGDGEMRSQIEQKIFELGIQDQVHLTGFLQQAELLPYFAHAKCFVHTSTTEQWGLVVNEAMAAGLPVLVSNRCGCYEDLLIEGINGFGFDPEDQAELTNLMLKMSAKYIDLEEMGKAALMHIQNFSPNYFAQGVQNAIAFVSNKS